MVDDEPGVGSQESETETRPPTIAAAELPTGAAESTVGTGSVLGIGCLVVVVLLIVIAIAFRWFGGSW